MEKKLARKIILSFLFTTLASLCIFTVCLFYHERKSEEENMTSLLEQVNTIYERNQALSIEKEADYMNHYIQHLEILDFVLLSDKERCSNGYLKHLRNNLAVGDIYLFDKAGRVVLSSNDLALGEQLPRNHNSEFVWELMDNPDVFNAIALQEDQILPAAREQDLFFKKTELADYALAAIGIDQDILPDMEAEVSVDRFLQESPVEDGSCLMVVDKETKEILGSTKNRDFFEYIDQIYEEKDLLEQLRTSEEAILFHADHGYLLAKSKILDDVFLVCLTKMNSISSNVKMQAVFCALVLFLTAVVLIFMIRSHFRTYVFDEFAKIETTVSSLISGNADVEFEAPENPEMRDVVTALNRWKSTFVHQEQQITDTSEKLLEAKNASEHDSLTGLLNRYGFEKKFRKRMDKKSASGIMLMMDLDNFKKLNDTYGHPEGDTALKQTAAFLKHEFRNTDLIARLGGDEFVVYIYNPPIPNRQVLENRLTEVLKHLNSVLPEHYRECGISLSIGAAYMDHERLTCEALYQLADEALYSAKERGKNGFVIH